MARVALDDNLVADAKRLGQHESKRAAVHEALREYVALRRQRGIVAPFGTLDWDEASDYEKERRKR